MRADIAKTVTGECNQRAFEKDALILAINQMCFTCVGYNPDDPEMDNITVFNRCKSMVYQCRDRECPLNRFRYGQPSRNVVHDEELGRINILDASVVDIKRRKRIKKLVDWTARQDGILMQLSRDGLTIRQIAVAMRRDEDNVIRRLDVLMKESVQACLANLKEMNV